MKLHDNVSAAPIDQTEITTRECNELRGEIFRGKSEKGEITDVNKKLNQMSTTMKLIDVAGRRRQSVCAHNA